MSLQDVSLVVGGAVITWMLLFTCIYLAFRLAIVDALAPAPVDGLSTDEESARSVRKLANRRIPGL